MNHVLKIVLLIAIVAGGYFGVYRDKFLQYPYSVSLTNMDGEVLNVNLLGRSSRMVQFKKTGDQMLYEYPISKLNVVSKVKLTFYPNKLVRKSSSGSSSGSDVSEMHLQGMNDEMERYVEQMKLLRVKLKSKSNPVERGHVQHEIDLLQEKINVLVYKMELHRSRSK
ncbi:MAG TPA: hypothetical protein DCX06_13135 [Opitutae bacterium]|nr:hypothetical protein [Opitutae bacterium]